MNVHALERGSLFDLSSAPLCGSIPLCGLSVRSDQFSNRERREEQRERERESRAQRRSIDRDLFCRKSGAECESRRSHENSGGMLSEDGKGKTEGEIDRRLFCSPPVRVKCDVQHYLKGKRAT